MRETISDKRKIKCAVLNILMYLSAAVICVALLAVIGYILYRGIPNISIELLTSKPSLLRGIDGILPNILNTVYVILITLVIVLPIGVGAAIYLSEYAKNKRIVKLIELDENSVKFEKEEVDMYELASEVIKRLGVQADKRGITLSLIGGSAYVFGVKKILDEMVYNLCDNAIKYNKENGSMDVIINNNADKVSVIVRDTGIGIARAEQDRVFERFYRVDKSHSKQVGGTGLGLSIVKHGAICHDAEIKLESTEGKGTSVTLTFDSAIKKQ